MLNMIGNTERLTRGCEGMAHSPAYPEHFTVTDDLDQLLAIIPPPIRQPLEVHPQRQEIIEIVLDLGRPPEARFPTARNTCGLNP